MMQTGFKRHKKSVTISQKLDNSTPTGVTFKQSQISSEETEVNKTHFSRKKLFNTQETKFISMKNINIDTDKAQPSIFDPISRLKLRIDKMEDNLAKAQKMYEKKINNIGKRLNKQCQKQICLAEQVMQLRNQLKKVLKIMSGLQQLIKTEHLCHKEQNKENRYKREDAYEFRSSHKENKIWRSKQKQKQKESKRKRYFVSPLRRNRNTFAPIRN